MNKKLSIIGYGHMGAAIIEGAVGAGVLNKSDVTVSEMNPAAKGSAEAFGLKTVSSPAEAAASADILLLAVKPGNLEDLSKEIAGAIPKGAVVVSICAGKKLSFLTPLFGEKVIRVMPNTPALVGEGMSALCKSEAVSEAELGEVVKIFSGFGKARILDEKLFDAVTAVSGSGPAYVYAFITALAKYAVEAGMTPEDAELFAAQTTLGAAKLALNSDQPVDVLKRNICTPGGTTVEAVKVLDARGFEDILIDAAKACAKRSAEIGGIK